MPAPFLVGIATDLVGSYVGGTLFGLAKDYILDSSDSNSSSGSADPVIPTFRPSKNVDFGKSAQRKSLADYAGNVSNALSKSKSSLSSAVSKGSEALSTNAQAMSSKANELLSNSGTSPLLINQVSIKESIDALVTAINSNSLITATMLSALDSSVSTIGSSLTTISSRMIELSSNYESSLLSTGEIPYMFQDDYYSMLEGSGLTTAEISGIRSSENAYLKELESENLPYPQIKQKLTEWRTRNVPTSSQRLLERNLSGIDSVPEYQISRLPSSTGSDLSEAVKKTACTETKLSLPNLERWALSQFKFNEEISKLGNDLPARSLNARTIKDEFDTSPYTFHDNGQEIEMTPIEVRAKKDFSVDIAHVSENNLTVNDLNLDYFEESFTDFSDISKIFTFNGISEHLSEIADRRLGNYFPNVDLKG